MVDVRVEVRGLRETQKKLEQVLNDLRGSPMLQAMRDATLIVERSAKLYAPVDTGRLRASITPEVRTGFGGGDVIQGVVGSNVEYAPYQELGTRRMKGKRYLQRAVEDNAARIFELLNRAVHWIMER